VKYGFFRTGVEWSIGVGVCRSLDAIGELVFTPSVFTAADVVGLEARFVADPFICEVRGKKYLFMEILDKVTEKGVIGWAELEPSGVWRFGGIALERPFHLSYPQVIELDGQVYMIPETSSEGSVRLYRATQFPSQWEEQATLLEGYPFSDASLLRHGCLWWMFVETSTGPKFDTLRLFMSSRLEGPWLEHSKSPIVSGDAGASRPAGPPVRIDTKLVRFAQDCRESYGAAVFGFEVVHLSPDAYEERPLSSEPLLSGRGSGWNGQGMHHVSLLRDGEQWLAAVDGRPFSGLRRPGLQRRQRR
jgi:hypothetical protein